MIFFLFLFSVLFDWLENYVTTLIKNAKWKFPRQAFFLKKIE